ncbi:hypothetical protein COTS27_01451 [Spirochaetota bacterium]|nr:hypothetical protein COTS27_01451 [Spirochaetota bacterium]
MVFLRRQALLVELVFMILRQLLIIKNHKRHELAKISSINVYILLSNGTKKPFLANLVNVMVQ